MTCLSCSHDEPHSGGGLGVCLHAGCGCDGPVDGKPVRWVNTAPMQRAIDAAAGALRAHALGEPREIVARLAVQAAWPHLCGRLAGENAALREINEERWERASEWEAVAHDLAEALREAWVLSETGMCNAALAAYDRAQADD